MSRPAAPATLHAPRTRLRFSCGLRSVLPGLVGLLLALAPIPAAAAAATEAAGIVRIWPGYRTADSFTTVGELFGGGERRSGRILRRTQPDSREGFYFLTRLRLAEALPAAEVRLELVLPASPNVVTHRFTLDLPSGEPVLHLGVTGSDWSGADSRPVAWRLSVRARDAGPVLVQSQSALWTAP
jgi:hypothetical protein